METCPEQSHERDTFGIAHEGVNFVRHIFMWLHASTEWIKKKPTQAALVLLPWIVAKNI